VKRNKRDRANNQNLLQSVHKHPLEIYERQVAGAASSSYNGSMSRSKGNSATRHILPSIQKIFLSFKQKSACCLRALEHTPARPSRNGQQRQDLMLLPDAVCFLLSPRGRVGLPLGVEARLSHGGRALFDGTAQAAIGQASASKPNKAEAHRR